MQVLIFSTLNKVNEWMNEWMNKFSEWALSYDSIKVLKCQKLQAHNQDFAGQGKIHWIRVPIINISSKTQEKKDPTEKNFGIFSPRYSWSYILNGNLTQRCIQSRPFFQN